MTVSGHEALFSTQPVKKSKQPPVLVVGLPRSGSSFLAHVISHLNDWFIFDDLYLYREAKANNAVNNPLTSDQLDKLIFFLGWKIRARIKYGIFCKPDMTLDEVDEMNDALKETFKDSPVYWYELQEEWMTRLCLNQGCKYWGYKAPQDFQLTEVLDKAYPGIKYIFLFRDPRKMLRSLKYVRDQDGTPEQYHPVIYSIYWKKAMQTMNRLCRSIPDRILTIKYEELAVDPHSQAQKIAEYLNTSISKPIDSSRSNSSFKKTGPQEITPTETKICEIITHQYLVENDYPSSSGTFRIRDIPNLLKTSLVFSLYQLKRIMFQKSARISILMYLKRMFKS